MINRAAKAPSLRRFLPVPGLLLILFLSACGLFRRGGDGDIRNPLVDLLIRDSGFEQLDAWQESAPPGYSAYAVMELDAEIRSGGRHSGHIAIMRHPTRDGTELLHAWTQKLEIIPRGRNIRLGGWVRASGIRKLHLGIEFEVATPREGQTMFRQEVALPPDDGAFHFVDRTVYLPPDATTATFYAGIATVGEVWFDNLYVFVTDD